MDRVGKTRPLSKYLECLSSVAKNSIHTTFLKLSKLTYHRTVGLRVLWARPWDYD